MSAAYLSPLFGAGAQLFDSQGRVLASGTINTYLAGTTTPQATYTDSGAGTPNATSITLDSAGRPTQEIWLAAGVQYKFIVLNSLAVQQGPTWDNISGINDPGVGGGATSTEWVAGTAPTFAGATQFSVAGDKRTTYAVGQRVKYTVTAGTGYGTVSAVAFGAVTTVTVIADSTAIDSGLSAVWFGNNSALAQSVDAAGSSYKETLVPAAAPVNVASILQRVDRADRLVTTGGTGAAYTVTATPALAAYSVNAPVLVKFHADAATPTMNINGLGALNLKQITDAGAKTAATVKTGQVAWVIYDGVDLIALVPVAAAAAATTGRYLRTTIFTAGGTWTKGGDVGSIIGRGLAGGGGGGGGNGGGGGGAGGFFQKVITSPSSTYSVTIGTGGGTNAAGGNTILSTMTATGGAAGGAGTPGAGGAASGGDINFTGGGGGPGAEIAIYGGTSAFYLYGAGGNAFFGGGGVGNNGAAVAPGGVGSPNSGGGGGGGAAGAAGIVIVDEYST